MAEIKQFDAGPSEHITLRKLLKEMDESDAFYTGVPGDRVRAKIDSAMPQLKQLCGRDLPALLVLYDNVQLWPEYAMPMRSPSRRMALKRVSSPMKSLQRGAPASSADGMARLAERPPITTEPCRQSPYSLPMTKWSKWKLSQLVRTEIPSL
jgi:hypothetical protein